MAKITTYDPKKVLISFAGREITGYADGTFITIEPHGEGFTLTVGSDGEMVRSIDPDDALVVTLTLLQSSESNDHLSTIYQLDKKTGKGLVPLLIKDGTGRTRAAAGKSYISQLPSVGFAKTGEETREWSIIAADGQIIVGGNS